MAVGECYQHGTGVLPNHQLAMQYYQKAAEQWYPHAYTRLGKAYYNNGIGGKNENLSYTYFKKAAEAQDPEGQYFLGLCYSNGFGVEANSGIARMWWDKGAAQGNEDAKMAPYPCHCCTIM